MTTERVTTDAVDELLDAWGKERPEVDLSPLEIFSRVSRLAVHLARIRALVFADVDLEEWGFDVLAALRRNGPPYQLSPGAVQQQTLVGSATTTHRIDRLESLGYVVRSPSPDDGRGVVVQLTPVGRSRVDLALELLASAESDLLEGVSKDDRQHLVEALRVLLTGLEANLSGRQESAERSMR